MVLLYNHRSVCVSMAMQIIFFGASLTLDVPSLYLSVKPNLEGESSDAINLSYLKP